MSNAAHSKGFPPVISGRCRTLLLGTLPGPESLRQQQYYAQPRNAFWRIMGELVGAEPEMPYERRLERLLDSGIGLWDVCRSAHRPGALDADIVRTTIRTNDFAVLFRQYPALRLIAFNGQTAQRLYRRLVLPSLDETHRALATLALPSTSPAYAAMRYEEKCAHWKRAIMQHDVEIDRDQDRTHR